MRRHLLARELRATAPVDAARAVVALHSTDPVTVFLSVHARTEGVAPRDVERALYEERSLVRMLGMRRTLFVVPRELVPIVEAAATVTVAARERRRLEQQLAESGISTRPARWLADASRAALRALEARGEAFTSEVAADVPALAKPLRLAAGTRFAATQSAATRVLPLLAAQGRLVRARPRGSWISSQYRWTLREAWLDGGLAALEPEIARAELLRAWLAAFGPATEADLRWWTGWTARGARQALAGVEHAAVDLDGRVGYVLADDVAPVAAPDASAALLPSLDPTTMGWKERDWYLGAHAPLLFDTNGNAGPTVWWNGRVVGGWTQRRDGEIAFRVLEDVGADALATIEREAERLQAWLGDVRFQPRFPTPLQRELR